MLTEPAVPLVALESAVSAPVVTEAPRELLPRLTISMFPPVAPTAETLVTLMFPLVGEPELFPEMTTTCPALALAEPVLTAPMVAEFGALTKTCPAFPPPLVVTTCPKERVPPDVPVIDTVPEPPLPGLAVLMSPSEMAPELAIWIETGLVTLLLVPSSRIVEPELKVTLA